MKNKFKQIHLRNGQIKEFEDICRSVEFDDGFFVHFYFITNNKQDDKTDNEVFYQINLFKHIVKPE